MSSDEELSAWFRAAIEARREAAKLAAREGGAWTQDDPLRYSGRISSLGGPVVYDEGSPDEYQAAHIALNDPQDTIARCEAALAILDLHKPVIPVAFEDEGREWRECQECGPNNGLSEFWAVPGQGEAFWPCETIRLLASGYRHWPGYREEWGPMPGSAPAPAR